jgi:SEC-C motif-containing protein
MRSRYSAYVVGADDYVLRTWHASTRPLRLDLTTEPVPKWLGLKIINFSGGRAEDATGEVEFVARYKVQGRAVRLHEHSRFVREQGHWYYLDGQID